MKRRTFVLHLGTGGMVGMGSCAMLPGAYSIDTPTEEVCDRESTVTNVVQQFAAPTAVDSDHWAAGESEPVGHLELYGSAESARAGLPFDKVSSGRRETVESFVEDTHFRNAVVLYVASVGPSAAHDTIRLCGLRTEDDALVGRAVVPTREESTDGEEERAYPSALVRVVTGKPRPAEARLTIESAVGTQREFTAGLG